MLFISCITVRFIQFSATNAHNFHVIHDNIFKNF